jgi:hypothetical protein
MVDRIAEIEARLSEHCTGRQKQMHEDIAYLLAEVKRLEEARDEALALHSDALAGWNKSIDRVAELGAERNEARALALSLAEALEPFGSHEAGCAKLLVEDDVSVMGERICDWLGLSDFRAAYAALSSPALLKLRGE